MASKFDTKSGIAAPIVAVFEKAIHSKPSGEYVRLVAKGRTAAYLSARAKHHRFDHLAVSPTAAETKSFGTGGMKGGCIFVTADNLGAVVKFATRLAAETPAKESKPAPAKADSKVSKKSGRATGPAKPTDGTPSRTTSTESAS